MGWRSSISDHDVVDQLGQRLGDPVQRVDHQLARTASSSDRSTAPDPPQRLTASRPRLSERAGTVAARGRPGTDPDARRSGLSDVSALLRGPQRAPATRPSSPPPARCASSPVPARARPGCSPIASRTVRPSARSTPTGCSRSPSPARRPESSATASAASACVAASTPAPSTPSPTRSCANAGRSAACAHRSCSSARSASSPASWAPAATRTAPLDVVAEIEWAAAPRVTPENYAAAAARARRRPAARAGHGRRDLRPVHDREAATPPGRLRRPAPSRSTGPGRGPRLRSGSPLAVPAPVRRRVPGRQPAAVRAARRPGWAPSPTSASSATPTRRSTRGTAPTRST